MVPETQHILILNPPSCFMCEGAPAAFQFAAVNLTNGTHIFGVCGPHLGIFTPDQRQSLQTQKTYAVMGLQ